MSQNPYSAPKSKAPLGTLPSGKIRPLWRLVAAVLSLGLVGFGYAAHQAALAMAYYNKNHSPSIGLDDIALAILAVYLLLVAICGKWRLFKS